MKYKMAYIATNPKTGECYAICSADPKFLSDTMDELKRWEKDGAIIELLPAEDAKERFCERIPVSLTTGTKQINLF